MRGSLATRAPKVPRVTVVFTQGSKLKKRQTETQQHKQLTTENSNKAISWDADGKEETQSHINANFCNHVVLHAPQV